MEILEIYENLCAKDPRHPDWEYVYSYNELEDKPEPRVDCFCDNCFYGRDRLALEILRLLGK